MDFVSKKKGKKKRDASLKVVYISSPMKVKTSASKFRTIVQKLTGQDSDISTYMDGTHNSATTDFEILPETFAGVSTKSCSDLDDNINHRNYSSSKSSSSSFSLMDRPRESPTSSDSLLEQSFPFGHDAFNMNSQFEEQYLQGVFPSSLFSDSSRLDIDVLGSYEPL